MPPDDRANGRRQGVGVQGTGDPESSNQVVSGRSRLQLIEKPKSILREGSWQSCWSHLCLCSLDVFILLPEGSARVSSGDGMSMTGKRLGDFIGFGVAGCFLSRLGMSRGRYAVARKKLLNPKTKWGWAASHLRFVPRIRCANDCTLGF